MDLQIDKDTLYQVTFYFNNSDYNFKQNINGNILNDLIWKLVERKFETNRVGDGLLINARHIVKIRWERT